MESVRLPGKEDRGSKDSSSLQNSQARVVGVRWNSSTLSLVPAINLPITTRVRKCHGYDGYIRVKKLASSGKNWGRTKNKPLFGRFVQQVDKRALVESLSTSIHHKKPLQVCFVGFKR